MSSPRIRPRTHARRAGSHVLRKDDFLVPGDYEVRLQVVPHNTGNEETEAEVKLSDRLDGWTDRWMVGWLDPKTGYKAGASSGGPFACQLSLTLSAFSEVPFLLV